MKLGIPKDRLLELIVTQVRNNFLIESGEENVIQKYLDPALERIETCFRASDNKYFWKNDRVYFSPYHSAQYCIFLYYLANTLHIKALR